MSTPYEVTAKKTAGIPMGFFERYLPAEQIDSYIAGLIILAAAPCTAMVFVWSNLSSGEPHLTSLRSHLMM